jgi:ABC-type Mn2+/Zn2+ transport system permease subunit
MATWLGLFVAFYEPYPVSFFITTIVFVLYLIVRFLQPKIKPVAPGEAILQGIERMKT